MLLVKTTSNIDNSNNQIHNQKMKTHKCEICEKEFKNKSILHAHIYRIHDEQKENKCNICQRIFFCKVNCLYIWKSCIKIQSIINVSHVERHSPNQGSWIDTLIQLIMFKKITNVTHVENHFLMQEIWRDIFTKFTIEGNNNQKL